MAKTKLTSDERSELIGFLMTAALHYDRLAEDLINERPFAGDEASISCRTASKGFKGLSEKARIMATRIMAEEVQL